MGKIFCTRCGFDITEETRLIDVSKVVQKVTGEQGCCYRVCLEFGSAFFSEQLDVADKKELSENNDTALRKFKQVYIDWEAYRSFFHSATGIDLGEYDSYEDQEEENSDKSQKKKDFLSGLSQVLEIPGSFTQAYERIEKAESWLKQLRKQLNRKQKLQLCWVKCVHNGRIMPYRMAMLDEVSGNILYPSSCCCPHCKKGIPSWMGAFEQKVIGIVGGQEAGKTSYITALSDLIKTQNIIVDKFSGNHGSLQIMTSYHGEDDLGWLKQIHMPGDPDVDTGIPSDERSPYWYYRSAYSVPKTEVQQDAISVISFLVNAGQFGKCQETIQYVLVDIPGEAFADPHNYYKIQEDFFHKYGKIIFQCSGILMIISADHLEGRASINLDYHRVLENAKEFFHADLGDKPIGLVVSMFDKLAGENMDVSKVLKLAFDFRNSTVYIVDSIVDNQGNPQVKECFAVETMQAISRQVERYVERRAPGISQRIFSMYQENSGKQKVAFFPVAAYGKDVESVPEKGNPNNPVSETSKNQTDRKKDYQDIVDKRFLVEAPLLWILACDGILTCGRRLIENDRQLDHRQQEKFQHLLENKLYWTKAT